MMMKRFVLAVCLSGAALVHAQGLTESPDLKVRIAQGGQQVVMQPAGGDSLMVRLRGDSFDINFPGEVLNVCAWTDSSIFEKAAVGSDTMQDFTSCMFMYKSLAMEGNATYLYLSEEAGFSLYESHGAQRLSEKRSQFHVTHFAPEGRGAADIPLAGFAGEVYVVMWIDKNRNQVVDAGEVERLVLAFQ
jgi:hypothetical protein